MDSSGDKAYSITLILCFCFDLDVQVVSFITLCYKNIFHLVLVYKNSYRFVLSDYMLFSASAFLHLPVLTFGQLLA